MGALPSASCNADDESDAHRQSHARGKAGMQTAGERDRDHARQSSQQN